MQLPTGTALNSALLENVFVTLVCILNRIPVFIVGKPGTLLPISFLYSSFRFSESKMPGFLILYKGCSKSLSMQLINSNLRGPDSSNEFFKSKPQVL